MVITETVFWVLTALAEGRRHGYALLRDVEQLSGGSVGLRVTTLYATLERLQRGGLVVDAGDEVVSGRARRYFELAPAGRTALEEESARLEARARAARGALRGSAGASAPQVGLV